MNLKKLCILTFSIMLLSGGMLSAQENTHDGFFFRAHLGFGSGEVVYEDFFPGEDLVFTGLTGLFSLQLGFAIVDNVIIHGLLTSYAMQDPDVELGGASASTTDTEISIFELGVGMTLYAMPSNFYFSASLTFPEATLTIDNTEGSSDTGMGVYAAIGKEWWVSENWGLGIALFVHYGVMPDQPPYEDHDIKSLIFGIAFSATYN
jgi:hypothetical protein